MKGVSHANTDGDNQSNDHQVFSEESTKNEAFLLTSQIKENFANTQPKYGNRYKRCRIYRKVKCYILGQQICYDRQHHENIFSTHLSPTVSYGSV